MNAINRRNFLKTATMTSAGAVILPITQTFSAPVSGSDQSEPKRFLEPLNYDGVRLQDGMLKTQYDRERDYFYNIPNDDILKGFRERAGLRAPGDNLRGWYSGDLTVIYSWSKGDEFHTFGQWLSGMARMTLLTTVYYMTSWRSFPLYDKGSVRLTMRYNGCIRGLAAEFDCILADVWGAEGGADWLIHYDGVHANRVGNMLIGHRIFEAIAQHSSGLTNRAFQQGRDTEWSRETTRMRAEVGDPFKKTW